MWSASTPVRNGPGASPSRLLIRVSVANAVAWMAGRVRLATIALAGPAVPPTTSMPAPISTSCAWPAGSRNAVISKTQQITL
ncbi:hypothetical protein D3C72_1726190 [compost metagenome]